MRIHLQRIDTDLPIPSYAHPDDAGLDLMSAVDITLKPGQRRLTSTGIAIALPPRTCGMVVPRSGLAHKYGLSIVNTPGIIDAGYRGEIFVNLINLGDDTIELARGDRIAQLLVVPVIRPQITLVDELSTTVRGTGGHGSTGL